MFVLALRCRLYLESSYDPNAIALGGALQAPQGGGCTNISAIVNARTYRTTGNLGEAVRTQQAVGVNPVRAVLFIYMYQILRRIRLRVVVGAVEVSLTRVTKSYLLALGTTQMSSYFTKH